MAYSNSSSAYDFSMFEMRPARKAESDKPQRSQPESRRTESKPKTASKTTSKKMSAAKRRELARQRAMLTFLSIVLVSAVVLLIGAKTARTEVTHLLDAQQQKMDTLTEEHGAMMVEFERRMSDVAIEEYVISLGMQKRESLQTDWVEVPGGDVFEIAVDRSAMSPVEAWCDNLLTYFS